MGVQSDDFEFCFVKLEAKIVDIVCALKVLVEILTKKKGIMCWERQGDENNKDFKKYYVSIDPKTLYRMESKVEI